MLTAYSPASVVGRFLKDNLIPQETFAGIVGLSTGATSEYLSGKKNLPGGIAEQWLDTIKTMKLFIERSAPLPLNWHPRMSEVLQKMIQDFENRRLLISVINLGPEREHSPEIIRAAEFLAGYTTTKD